MSYLRQRRKRAPGPHFTHFCNSSGSLKELGSTAAKGRQENQISFLKKAACKGGCSCFFMNLLVTVYQRLDGPQVGWLLLLLLLRSFILHMQEAICDP